ncbi:MAG: sterol-binding protein [Burkholderia sp.]|nr:sterol-binding protein [Burkholderia sp.]
MPHIGQLGINQIDFLSKFFVIIVNHLLFQETWARDCLIPYSRKIAHIKLTPISIIFIVQRDGYLSIINENDINRVDASIIFTGNVVTSFINGGWPLLMKQVKIDGDVQFLKEIVKLGRYLRWDLEEDLAKLIGDECAYRIITLAHDIGLCASRISRNIVNSLTEYWLDENPKLVRRVVYRDFIIELSRICAMLIKIEKQIDRLEKRCVQKVNRSAH